LEREVLYCPTCRNIAEAVVFCSFGGKYDISPPEEYVHCCTCGSNEVYYTELCSLCGSPENVYRGVCDNCRRKNEELKIEN